MISDSDLRYSIATYKNRVIMSEDSKFLLVEGCDDKRLFKILKDEISPINDVWQSLLIHCAEEFKGVEADGAREIVQQLTDEIGVHAQPGNFAGFVDREFRGFELEPELSDALGSHYKSGYLVWSRGHSVENYYFDFSVLRHPLRTFSVTEHFDSALNLFSDYIVSTIKLACAASLAGRECDNRLKLVKSSIDWTLFNFSEGNMLIDTDKWKKMLIQRNKVVEAYADTFIDSFCLWIDRVNSANFDVIRWLCHGHIGLSFLWAAYGRCVYEVCRQNNVDNPEQQVQRVLKAEESVRFNSCAEEWVNKLLGRQCLFPNELFELLHLPLPVANS